MPAMHAEILPYVSRLALSLDGATPEVNGEMRAGSVNSFDAVIESIKLVQDKYPDVKVAVRSVLAKRNSSSVAEIPHELQATHGIDISKIVFKLCQIGRMTEKLGDKEWPEWDINAEACRSICGEMKERYPNSEISLQLCDESLSGRYYTVNTRGDAFGNRVATDGEYSYIPLGSPVKNMKEALALFAGYASSNLYD
jgi:sulfatase maturation enzyme AslB (radical SAM superfamily)